jgi:hypothetical protein
MREELLFRLFLAPALAVRIMRGSASFRRGIVWRQFDHGANLKFNAI